MNKKIITNGVLSMFRIGYPSVMDDIKKHLNRKKDSKNDVI